MYRTSTSPKLRRAKPIRSQVELRSDLYNWCLVSRATRDFATPRLFEEILVTSSSRAPIRKVAENLRGLFQLSSKRLAHVKKFEAWCSYARDTPESDLGELLEVLEACIEKAIRLEEFREVYLSSWNYMATSANF